MLYILSILCTCINLFRHDLFLWDHWPVTRLFHSLISFRLLDESVTIFLLNDLNASIFQVFCVYHYAIYLSVDTVNWKQKHLLHHTVYVDLLKHEYLVKFFALCHTFLSSNIHCRDVLHHQKYFREHNKLISLHPIITLFGKE